MKLKLDYVARVEGEATVILDIKDGRLNDLKLNIWEPPRFFEGFLVGRRYDEAPDIVARICGICPVSHMTAAIRALEKCLSIAPSPEAIILRRIMSVSQTTASHLIHLYVLVLPDYLGFPSVAEMLGEYKKDIVRFLRMKEVLNDITAAFGGGRAIHPIAMTVAGFTDMPSRDKSDLLIKRLEEIRPDAIDTLELISRLKCPEFDGPSEYAAIKSDDNYTFTEGRLTTSKGINAHENDYRQYFEEAEVPHANAKRTIIKGRGAMMVGALARVKLKYDMLHPEAKEAAEKTGFPLQSNNPFHNNLAQAVEVVHGVNELLKLLDGLSGVRPWVDIKPEEGTGSAITEAPRGLLYHHYALNRRGIIEKADIVTPTAHNFLGIEENLRKFVEENIDLPQEELSLKCEMLVRAYDPCFSCSVH